MATRRRTGTPTNNEDTAASDITSPKAPRKIASGSRGSRAKAANPSTAGAADATAADVSPREVTARDVSAPEVGMPETPAAPARRIEISPEDRYRMIAEAAYLRAQKRGFEPGSEVEDWLAAEREIDALLSAEHAPGPQ